MKDKERQMMERNLINENYDYYKQSGCGPIVATILIIAAFWIIVGIIYLFT